MNSPAKVLHILSGDLWAGKEYQVVAALGGARDAGQKPAVLLFNLGESADRCHRVGAEVTVIDEKNGFLELINSARDIYPPRIIFAHGYKEAVVGLLLSWSTRAKLVTVHHGRPEDTIQFRSRLYHFLHISISRLFAAKVVFVSDELKRGLGFGGSKKAVVIHNTLMPTGKNADPTPSEADQIVAVGRLVGVKRFDLAIDSFTKVISRLPEQLKLLIVGDGPERRSLEATATKSGSADRVSFLGFRSDASALIASARLLLITSDNEGIPTVLLEAMRAGTPVLSTAVGGIVEISALFQEFPIKLVDRGNVSALSDAIGEICSASGPRIRVSAAAQQKFNEYFSPKRVFGDYMKLMNSLGVDV